MSDNVMFGGLERSERERDEKIGGNRAITAALVRTSQHHKPFIRRAESQAELHERVALLTPTIRSAVEDVCQEHEYDNVDRVMSIVLADLRHAGGHPKDCDCAFCQNKGKLPGSKSEDNDTSDDDADDEYKDKDSEKEAKTAQGEGSTYQGESLELGANDTGLQDIGSPKIDKKHVPADGLDIIDVASKDHPLEHQTMGELKQGEPYQSGDGFEVDPSKRPRKTVDADAAMQPEHNVAPHTDTWNGTGDQASPVTEKALARVAGTKWSVIG